MDDDKQLTYPLVHMNGSGKDNLLDGYRKAWEALSKAKEALQATTPHERDYYPLEDGKKQYGYAYRQHSDRLIAVEEAMDDMKRLALHVQKT
jgi:hypothetical protein